MRLGNDFDVRQGVPKGYRHIPGERLQPLCRKLGIKFSMALIGFEKSWRYWKPVFDGVVVTLLSAAKLSVAIEARKQRALSRPQKTPEQKAAERQRRQQRDIDRFAAKIRKRFPKMPAGEENKIASRACVIGSGRVGRSSTADDPVHAAVVAHIRHHYTEYDTFFDEVADYEDREQVREDARHHVRDKIDAILDQWSDDE